MKEENLELRTRIHQQEQTKVKKDKIIREFQLRMKYPNGEAHSLKSNPYVLSSLRRMYREAFRENEKLRKELRKLQEDPRFTEANELEGEHRAYLEEMERLQELINKAETSDKEVPIEDAKAMNTRLKEQNSALEKIKNEKNRLLKEIKQNEKEVENYKKNTKAQSANKELVENNMKEIARLKDKIKSMKDTKTDNSELEKVKKTRNDAANKLEEMKNKFNNLRKELEELKNNSSNIKTNHKEITKPSQGIIDKLKSNIGGTEELKSKLFGSFNESESISLHELAKVLTRTPCKLNSEDGLKIAEYVIGAKGTKRSKLMEGKLLAEVIKKLSTLLNDVPELNIEKSSDSKVNKKESMTEEQLMEAFQKCYHKIKNQISSNQLSINDLFGSVVFTKKIEGIDQQVLHTKDFFKILEEKLSLKLDETEKTCLSKIMSASDDDDDIIRFDMVDQIVNEEPELDFKELDNISLIIFYALSEYMNENKLTIEKIFADSIYQQDVQIDQEEATIELINSEDFFRILGGMGIMIEENEHKNLNNFLCIDPEFPDKLVVNKLKQALEEFEMNEDLKAKAFKYYKVLAEEQVLDENN